LLPEEAIHARVPGAGLGPGGEARNLLGLGQEWLRQELLLADGKTTGGKALALLVATPWPAAEVLELLSHPGRIDVTVAAALKDIMNLPESHPLLARALTPASSAGSSSSSVDTAPRSYNFRVNPYREMVSDMVRHTRLPFCGLRPFMRMVADIAKTGIEAGCPTGGGQSGVSELCEFNFLEGGPHLGDCALWAATALRLAGVQLKAIAFEPLPDASALFQQSVAENDLAGSVSVRTAALGQGGGKMIELIYFFGHNGQATVNGVDFPSQNQREVVKVPAPEAALDEEVPATWPMIDALKLSVNGAERHTLAGARRLLSQRRICSVLMHATKCKRGRKPASEDPAQGNPNASKFSYELMQYLHEGNMDVFEHDDGTGPRSGAVKRLHNAMDMDAVFDDPGLTEQVYFLALSKEERCTRAKRHFHAALGRSPGSQLEDS